jgi:uncharacterized HAD superfamily protein
MLCSRCSSHVKPVVALDIDGTLGDYHGSLGRFASDYFGRHFDMDGFNGTYELNEYLGLTKEEYRVMKLAYRQGGQKRMMPMFEGARELAEDLREAGAEIWITTTRPWQRFDSTDPDTRHWLDRNGIPWDHLLFDDDKYSVLSNMVERSRIVAVLEDLASNYDRGQELELPMWLIKTQYNRGIHRHFELASLMEARHTFVEAVELWKP